MKKGILGLTIFFSTFPSYAARLSGGGSGSGTTLVSGSTQYIQNTLVPTISSQAASVAIMDVKGVLRITSATFSANSNLGVSSIPAASTIYDQDLTVYSNQMAGYNDSADTSFGGKGGGWKFYTGNGGIAQGASSGTGGDGGDFIVVLGTAGTGIDQPGVDGLFAFQQPSGANLFSCAPGASPITTVFQNSFPGQLLIYGSFNSIGSGSTIQTTAGNNHTTAIPMQLSSKFDSGAVTTGFGIKFPLQAQRQSLGSAVDVFDITSVWTSTTSAFVQTTFNNRIGASGFASEVMRFTSDAQGISINIGSSPVSGAKFSVVTDSNTYKGLVIKSTTNPLANAFEIQDSNSVIQTTITVSGVASFPTVNTTTVFASTAIVSQLLSIPYSSTATTSSIGQVAMDTNAYSSSMGTLIFNDSTQTNFVVASTNTPSVDGSTVRFNSTSGKVVWDTLNLLVSSKTVAAAVAATTTYGNIAQVSLTTGTWTINGVVDVSLNGATMTSFQIAISSNSGNVTSDHQGGDNQVNGGLATAANDGGAAIAAYPITLTKNAVMYLKENCTFGLGTPLAAGRITAIRQ